MWGCTWRLAPCSGSWRLLPDRSRPSRPLCTRGAVGARKYMVDSQLLAAGSMRGGAAERNAVNQALPEPSSPGT